MSKQSYKESILQLCRLELRYSDLNLQTLERIRIKLRVNAGLIRDEGDINFAIPWEELWGIAMCVSNADEFFMSAEHEFHD